MRHRSRPEPDAAPVRFAYDCTALVRDPAMVGVARVMVAVAEALLAEDDPGTVFVAYDHAGRRFTELDRAAVRALLARAHGGEARRGAAVAMAGSRLHHLTDRLLDERPATARTIGRLGYHARRAAHEVGRVPRAVRADRHAGSRHCASRRWGPDTTYCSLAFDYHDLNLALLHRLRAEQGVTVALVFYDLTPLVTPQYHGEFSAWEPSRRFTDVFRAHCAALLDTADRLIVSSHATRRDLEAFAAESGLEVRGAVQVPLVAALAREPQVRPARLAEPDAPAPGRFVLTVGTIEARKNHRLLLDVWDTMLRDLPRAEVPPLVVAGRTGWLFAETRARLECTPAYAGVVFWLDGPSDPELAWCYANAAFTCYPSRYEGWGLPVTESLAFGIPCLSSDAASLPETGWSSIVVTSNTSRGALMRGPGRWARRAPRRGSARRARWPRRRG
ncbi:MAG: glycosyltransferase family 1 protein, partial [Actinobacteria bacterium]|nr:glycosyltransferase family 1 protein [Actinomycetota bacterium]